ncbi:MAG: hypothetical protein FWF80_08900 [Defluviitaleaceae bacterium]|nr:hypothetical protein [Defluviitaleaceae bacterium]
MEGIILKDDTRYDYTEKYLQKKGYFINPHAEPSDLDFAVFPFLGQTDEAIYDDGFFTALKKNAPVFSGIRNKYLSEKCAKYGIAYYVMMDDKGVTVKNAVPTSEGVISYLINSLNRTVANSRILVIGYGVCGRDLSLRLTALGANVYALVRNREKECAAYADSATPIYHDEMCDHTFDAIVNTVPKCVLSDEDLKHTNQAVLIDIASKPYGFNMELAKKINSKSALLPGLPGKLSPQTAGEILGEYIDFVLRGTTK